MGNPFGHFIQDWQDADGKERAFMVSGALALVLAIVGIFLPIVPQVPFAILAAFLFSEGNPRLHKWIRHNKYLGPPVVDWEDKRVVKPKLKAFSTVAMIAGAAIGHYKLNDSWPYILDGVFAAAIIFVLTRKSK